MKKQWVPLPDKNRTIAAVPGNFSTDVIRAKELCKIWLPRKNTGAQFVGENMKIYATQLTGKSMKIITIGMDVIIGTIFSGFVKIDFDYRISSKRR